LSPDAELRQVMAQLCPRKNHMKLGLVPSLGFQAFVRRQGFLITIAKIIQEK
jgi:hypothetical protein